MIEPVRTPLTIVRPDGAVLDYADLAPVSPVMAELAAAEIDVDVDAASL